MSGFAFLWDRTHRYDVASLRRRGRQALSTLGHAFASKRFERSGYGWWLGICTGDGEPRVAVIADDEETTIVVLDGWIENFTSLADDMGWADQSNVDDADLVLALYRREGASGLHRLRGPLAVLVWLPREDRLISVRDHVGERAVCYADGQRLLMVASEESALFSHPAVSRTPDFGWLGRFVGYLALPPGRTAFRDIAELAPGELGTWGVRGMQRMRVPPELPTRLSHDTHGKYQVQRWRQALAEGIPAAVRRGRRFGVMLSGGMDSTTTAAFFVPEIKRTGKEVEAYCWRFHRFSEADESAPIEAGADRLGLRVNWIDGDGLYPVFEPGSWPVCPNLPQLNPFLRLNQAAFDAARESGCDVVVGGHLGDYLYPFPSDVLADSLRTGRWRKSKEELSRLLRRNGLAGFVGSNDLRSVLRILTRLRRRQRAPCFLSAAACNAFEQTDPWPPEVDQVPHPQQWTALLGTRSPMQIKYERYFAEHAGVERRAPLRHHKILGCAVSIPSYLFFANGLDKHLTRKATAEFLPPAVVNSQSGGSLKSVFVHGTFGETTRKLLLEKTCFWPEVLEKKYVLSAMDSGPESNSEQQRVLLAAIGMELWFRTVC